MSMSIGPASSSHRPQDTPGESPHEFDGSLGLEGRKETRLGTGPVVMTGRIVVDVGRCWLDLPC